VKFFWNWWWKFSLVPSVWCLFFLSPAEPFCCRFYKPRIMNLSVFLCFFYNFVVIFCTLRLGPNMINVSLLVIAYTLRARWVDFWQIQKSSGIVFGWNIYFCGRYKFWFLVSYKYSCFVFCTRRERVDGSVLEAIAAAAYFCFCSHFCVVRHRGIVLRFFLIFFSSVTV